MLTPLQSSRLLLGLGCNSNLMDGMQQLCQVVEAQWQQQWGQIGSSADRGHLLAASSAEAVLLSRH